MDFNAILRAPAVLLNALRAVELLPAAALNCCLRQR
jgi:hypothetical protein